MTASENVELLLNVSIEANIVDPDQTELSNLGIHCLWQSLQTTKADNIFYIGNLRVIECEFSV